ncbi:flagellar motor switch protein FliN [Pontiellaceae bacterium B1224]|nr:flagellar motor switch protein FliN [Pontiellaceae bacterium B1224]
MSEEVSLEQKATEQVDVRPISPAPLTEPAEGVTGMSEEVNLNMIMDIPVDVHVEIGRTSLPVREFLRLGVGSVLQLDRLVGESADLIINGQLVGRGDVVVIDETFGIRISELAGEKELMASW